MGIADTDSTVNGIDTDFQDAGFFSSVDVYFDMTGETDNGLSFGASIDLDDAGGTVDESGNAFADYTVFVSGAFGTLTMGDTDGALDWAMTEAGNMGNGGSIADNETAHAGYLGSYGDGAGDNTVLRYDYSMGDFGLAVSVEQSSVDTRTITDPDLGAPATLTGTVVDSETNYAVGFRYNVDMGGSSVALGGGIQQVTFDGASGYGPLAAADIAVGTEADIAGVSAVVTAGAFTGGLTFTQHEFDNAAGVEIADIDHFGVGLGYAVGALTLHANYGEFDGTVGVTPLKSDGIGLAAAYDLGGGASAHFGYNDGDSRIGTDTADTSSWSLGLAMSF